MEHLIKNLLKSFGLIVLLIFTVASPALAQSISPDDKNSIYNDTVWYDPTAGGAPISACGGSITLTGSDKEQNTWDYFKAKGLPDQQVAGIMGNIQQESSFDPERMQIGGDSQNPYDAGSLGWGIVQWSGNLGPRSTGDKVTAIYDQTGVTGNVYELSTQLDMVWAEMKGTSPNGTVNMLSGFEKITDAGQAATYFNMNFERGSDPDNVRESNAATILTKYGGSAPSGSVVSTGCESSSSNGSCKLAYVAEYSQDQLAKIFGNPGTADSQPDLKLQDTSFAGFNVRASPLIIPCLKSVEQQITAAKINYKITSVGCYRFDSDNGGSNIGLKSYHTYGAACDINPNTNNFYDTGPVPYNPNCPAASGVVDSGNCYDMPPQIVKIFADNGFYWGGNFNSVKDYMHFE